MNCLVTSEGEGSSIRMVLGPRDALARLVRATLAITSHPKDC